MTPPTKAITVRPVSFVSTLQRSTNRLWAAHLPVPVTAVRRLSSQGSRRVVCTLNGSKTFRCALVPYASGRWVITVNQSLRRSLSLEFGDRVEVGLTSDESRYGHPMPPELAEAMRQDTVARAYFNALTMGRQRTLLYIVNGVKDPVRRAHRATVILRHLSKNRGVLRYRELAGELKSPRTRSV